MSHPNATATGLTSGAAGLVIYVLSRCGIHGLTAEDGVAIAGGASALVLFVGRRGIRGTLAAIWRGSSASV